MGVDEKLIATYVWLYTSNNLASKICHQIVAALLDGYATATSYISPNLLPKYLSMFRLPEIFGPKGWLTSNTGTRPKGISAISRTQDNSTTTQLSSYLLALYSFIHWSPSNLKSRYFTSACAKMIRITSASPRESK